MSRGPGCRTRPQDREAGQVRQAAEERPESVVSDLITGAIAYGKKCPAAPGCARCGTTNRRPRRSTGVIPAPISAVLGARGEGGRGLSLVSQFGQGRHRPAIAPRARACGCNAVRIPRGDLADERASGSGQLVVIGPCLDHDGTAANTRSLVSTSGSPEAGPEGTRCHTQVSHKRSAERLG